MQTHNSLAKFILGLGAAVLATAAHAGTISQTNNLSSTLVDTQFTYSSDAVTRTGVTSFYDQTATNVGSTAQHLGFYVAWNWVYAGNGDETALSWDNTLQAFVGGGITMRVQYTGHADQYVTLGDVANDTWIGNPWPTGYANPITSQADWTVPLFDFGMINAGDSVTYGMTVTTTFTDQAAFDDWNAHGSFYIGGQGVEIPEPGSLALVGIAMLGLMVQRRRR